MATDPALSERLREHGKSAHHDGILHGTAYLNLGDLLYKWADEILALEEEIREWEVRYDELERADH